MTMNIWNGPLEITDRAGNPLARGEGLLEALLNPLGTWHGTLLATTAGIELDDGEYRLSSPGANWAALITAPTSAPGGDGRGTRISFRGVGVWPLTDTPTTQDQARMARPAARVVEPVARADPDAAIG